MPESRDEWIAKKSLFHSLRIIDFGIQVAKYEAIIQFTSIALQDGLRCPAYQLLEKIRTLPADWEVLNAEFKELYNMKSTEFRKVCPK